MLPPADWYSDPYDASLLRYWDGSVWTGYTAPRMAPQAEPVQPADAVAPDAARAADVVAVRVTEVTTSVTDRLRGLVAVRRTTKKEWTHQGGSVPSLEEIVQSLRLEAPRHPLDEQVEVAGETFHVKGIKRVFRENGMPITAAGSTLEQVECALIPEPWNPHDVNAVAVMVGAHQVGYLPADLAVAYSPGLKELAAAGLLATGTARIWAKADSGVVRARVTLLIPEAAAFL